MWSRVKEKSRTIQKMKTIQMKLRIAISLQFTVQRDFSSDEFPMTTVMKKKWKKKWKQKTSFFQYRFFRHHDKSRKLINSGEKTVSRSF